MGKSPLSTQSNRRMRLIMASQLLWLTLVCILGAWWGRLVLTQARRIADLETQLGLSARATQAQWARMQHMLLGESVVFFGLLLLATAILFGLYLREARRARSLQAFFASVTHELRTPLTSIRLQAESLADNTPADSGDRTLVERLLEDTTRLESQVERTLELARMEGGGAVLSQPLRMKRWLDYFLESWTQGFGHRLAVSVDMEECLVQADASAVQVIFKNLIDNSLKHAGHKNTVHVHLRTENDKDWIVLRYSDDGVGFQGDARKLGQIFYKGERSQGAGVGLYLVNTLMRSMGGRAEFTARPGLETSLYFRRGAEHA